ncbi:MAG: DUF3857 domain-containing protein [Mucilaginibacter sp.]
MKRLISSLYFVLVSVIAIAQNNYDASLIPKNLLPYASAVVRNEEVTTEVKDLNNVIYHVKRVITVLNKNGDQKAALDVYYDKITSVRYIKGFIYNEFGKVVQKIAERDFDDIAVTDGFSLFIDDRVKHYTKSVTQYPYTIEFEYELKAKQSLYFPNWNPDPEAGLAVEKSSYTFICKPDYNIRYKEINLPSTVVTNPALNGSKTYTWQVSNMKAIKYEPFSPKRINMTTQVIVAPEKFAYGDYSGSFKNWQQLGKWMHDNFLINREDVPDQTARYITELTQNITDPKLKAKKVYEYMQQKTHYISVQVGIGGFRPFAAADVDKDGYGDCKALVNYTKALLKVAGIDSYYCVVYGDRQEKLSMIDDFASIQGNHIILCLPFKNDTTWLECTSQQIPFGFLSDFTDDRTVLACTAEGGKLMHTPKYTTEENLEKRKANFVINEAGELAGNMETVFKGTNYDDRYPLIEEAPVERIKSIKRYYPINNLEIQKLEFKQDKSIKPVTIETVKLSAREYGAINDSKFYFSLNSVDRTSPLLQIRSRQNPVYINRGYTEEDEITYTLPKGYRLDSEPLKESINKPFGNFTATMTIEGDHLIYKRKFQLKDGTYNKETYQEMVDFYQSVADADNYNVILAKTAN